MITGDASAQQNIPVTVTPIVATPVVQTVNYNNGYINYVRTFEPSMAVTDIATVMSAARSVAEVKRTTQYFDGLGRPIQAVTKGVSPAGNDLVAPVIYDSYGREQYTYLPYIQQTDNKSDGTLKTTPFLSQQAFFKNTLLNTGLDGENIYYSQQEYEASPLNRVTKKYAPGNSWAMGAGNHPIENRYLINEAADSVRIWNTDGGIPVSSNFYPAGSLVKNVVVDESGSQRVEYADNEGRILLRKVQLSAGVSAHTGWLCTYYIYNDQGNLSFLLPPLAVERTMWNNWVISAAIAADLCTRYQYDERNRIAIKKTPGTGRTFMVYDVRDRLVFTQDSVQRMKSPKEWLTTFYDEENRPVMTAIYKTAFARENLQASLNTATYSESIISYPIPREPNLVVDTHDGRPAYVASNSITLESGFETDVNDEVIFNIEPSSTEPSVVAVTNPLPNISTDSLLPLTYTFYDDYSYVGPLNYSSADITKPQAGTNANAETQPTVPSKKVKGKMTGKRVRILGTDTWLTTTEYYNDKGRLIQEVTDNGTGGKDVISNLFDFSGKVLSTYHRQTNPRSTITPQVTLLSMMTYDAAGRLLTVRKQLNDNASLAQTVVDNKYDELGRLKMKRIGVKDQTTQLDTLTYTYNIRGWLSGINKIYVGDAGNTTSNWFGQELSYDKGFAQTQYNGNVAGVKWKSRSDAIVRAFGYSYDKTNRLTGADFNQQNAAGTTWTKDVADFSVTNLSYDANGNIVTMVQKGLIGKTISPIDNLLYRYQANSNKLLAVTDANNTVTAKLGDFNDGANTTGDDYTYDANGSMSGDMNKGISNITYNHLNLPSSIAIKGKGTISYLYNAEGCRLRKTIVDSTSATVKTTVTDYVNGMVYTQDSLQLISHEEGRIRAIYNTGQAVNYAFDYFEKDHQGNVRVVLGAKSDTSVYAATMEMSATVKENALFSNIDNTRVPVPEGYPADNTTNPNGYVAKLNAKTGNKIGPALVLRVMAGDTIRIGASAYYKTPATTTPYATSSQIVTALLDALSNTGISEGVHNATGAGSPLNTGLTGTNYDLLKQKDPGQNQSGKPRAYLNFAVFDDQFNLVDDNSGVRQVNGGPDALVMLSVDRTVIKKTGFLYVYTSNEMDYDVLFDNLVVVHNSGPLVEETHYYPFGLTMSAISARSLSGGIKENKFKYNGKELENREFANGAGLETYDFAARMQDPQLGRFLQIDPKSETFANNTPYNYCFNNPLLFVDPDGMEPEYTYNWVLSRYENGEGEEVPFSQVQSFLQVGGYSRAFDVMIFGKEKPGGKDQILGDNHGNTLWLALSYARKSASGSVKILQVQDANDAADQIEKLNGAVRNLFILSHGDASSAEGHQAYFSVGGQAFQAKDIAGSAAFGKIASKLQQGQGPLPTAAEVIIFACGSGGLYNKGDVLLTAIAKKLHAVTYGAQGFGRIGTDLFLSERGSQTGPVKGHDGPEYDAAKANQGNFTKVTPYGVGAFRVETVHNGYFDSFGRLHYDN